MTRATRLELGRLLAEGQASRRSRPAQEAVEMELRQRGARYLRSLDASTWPSLGDWVRVIPGSPYRSEGGEGVVVEVNTAAKLEDEGGHRRQVRVLLCDDEGDYMPLWHEASCLEILHDRKSVTKKD